MKTALIQLSDIHIRCGQNQVVNDSENPILGRPELIAAAVKSVCLGVQNAIIVVSGDTAYAGKSTEYVQGRKLIDRIRSKLSASFTCDTIPVITVPGNHDCDFSLAKSVRRIVIESLKIDNIDDDVIAHCTDIQSDYVEFAKDLNPSTVGPAATGIDPLYRQVVLDQGTKHIVFHLLNSAWLSQIHEKAGSLYFPVRLIKDRVTSAPHADIAVAVIHHPFNWYSPENARELRTLLEDHADIIMTGHEHEAGAYSKRVDNGEQNEYLEGGVLQETGHPDTSSFNLVVFDTDHGQQQTYRFVWNIDKYTLHANPYWRPFERNKRLMRNQFGFSDTFSSWLDDPGTGYTHPHKYPVILSDIFVYPDMRELQYERPVVDQPVIRSRDVVTYILNSGRVIIIADEKAGKTTLQSR